MSDAPVLCSCERNSITTYYERLVQTRINEIKNSEISEMISDISESPALKNAAQCLNQVVPDKCNIFRASSGVAISRSCSLAILTTFSTNSALLFAGTPRDR